MGLKIGLDLYPMQGTWAAMRDAVLAADRAGYDSLWTWDHLYGTDDPANTILEGWTSIAAWAAITSRPTVGLLVGANSLRNPALVAKMAVTVDHVSNGRCILGLGSGWRPREHTDHGIPFGASPGERLDWLDESAGILRRLLAGERVTSPPGAHYAFREASHRPLPFHGAGRLPILIGGGGERRTLRTVTKYADIWHHRGSPDHLARKAEVLERHCAEAGRDVGQIERAFGPAIIVRDDPAEARRVLEAAYAHNGARYDGDPDEAWLGPPDLIAERWRSYLPLGFRHLIAALPTPYDHETIERLVEARALLGGA